MPDPEVRLTTTLSDRYEIERELGHGGMAIVYLANDVKHDRKVALKVLRPELAAGDSVMAVPVDLETGSTGRPVLLFRGEYGNGDVTTDGERFLLIKTPDVQRPRRIELVLNWLDELEREVP